MSPCSHKTHFAPPTPGGRGANFQKSLLKWRLPYWTNLLRKFQDFISDSFAWALIHVSLSQSVRYIVFIDIGWSLCIWFYYRYRYIYYFRWKFIWSWFIKWIIGCACRGRRNRNRLKENKFFIYKYT